MTEFSKITPFEAKKILNQAYRDQLAMFTQRAFLEINAGQEFHHNWHFYAIAYELERVFEGKTKRLLITLPPRSLKSLTTTISFPAWVLGHNPRERIIAVSYASDLATAHAGSFRKIINANWYQQLFPHARIDTAKDTETETRFSAGGYRLTTTIGGSLTGRGGNVIIIDDPMKAADANSATACEKVKNWYDQTLPSRLDDKNTGAIILVMQRLHVDDLAGHVLKQGGLDASGSPRHCGSTNGNRNWRRQNLSKKGLRTSSSRS